MFTPKTPAPDTPGLQKAIDDVLHDMNGRDANDEEYAKMVEQLVKLHALKENEKPKRVSSDTLALIAGNLAGIALIVGYERTGVMTSKALGFLRQLR